MNVSDPRHRPCAKEGKLVFRLSKGENFSRQQIYTEPLEWTGVENVERRKKTFQMRGNL